MSESAPRLPGYLVEGLIGVGGHGRVWRARVRGSDDEVAVKLLPITGPDELAAARTEAALLIGLDHPHLVQLHEALPCPQGLALVLDLAAGGSLATLLRRRGRLAPGEVVAALAPVGAALAYAHNAGVVHGDVTPANVLFTHIGLPLLADLGVARLIDDAGDAPIHSTPAYVDPAVAAGGVPTQATDVFMLAGVALHALTGASLWPGETAEEALAAALAGDAGGPDGVAARLRSAEVPEPLMTVLCDALDADPARRPSAAEFTLDMRHAVPPVAVEFAAGRARHRAEDSHPAGSMLTYGHRVPRPIRPPSRVPVWSRGPDTARRLRRLGGVTVALAALVAAVLWVTHERGTQVAQARPPVTPAVTAPADGGAAEVGAANAEKQQPASAVLDAAGALRVLDDLDTVRAEAYARRDPALLARVYVAGPLLTEDMTQLQAIVPSGCGLNGARIEYADVTISARSSGRVTLTARATLRPSTLECAGKPAGRAPGVAPQVLRIGLQRSGSGYLIDSLSR